MMVLYATLVLLLGVLIEDSLDHQLCYLLLALAQQFPQDAFAVLTDHRGATVRHHLALRPNELCLHQELEAARMVDRREPAGHPRIARQVVADVLNWTCRNAGPLQRLCQLPSVTATRQPCDQRLQLILVL